MSDHDAKQARADEVRSCTCHPDDSPPRPCPQKYALTDCRHAAEIAALRARAEEAERRVIELDAERESATNDANRNARARDIQWKRAEEAERQLVDAARDFGIAFARAEEAERLLAQADTVIADEDASRARDDTKHDETGEAVEKPV